MILLVLESFNSTSRSVLALPEMPTRDGVAIRQLMRDLSSYLKDHTQNIVVEGEKFLLSEH